MGIDENNVNADGDTGDDWARNASGCAGGGVGVDRGKMTSSGDDLPVGGGENGTGTSDTISRGGVLAHRRGFGTCGWTGTGR